MNGRKMMKEFKFDHAYKSWDRYRAFHNANWGLVEFDTGEVMVMNYTNSDDRMMYDKYGIQLVATTDSDCPQLYLDKECTEPVKKAWITHHGMQEIAIDWEQKVAVGFGYRRNNELNTHLGSHVHSALVYWSGAKRRPIALGTIKIQTPNPEYKKKVQSILVGEVIPAITAMHKMDKSKHGYGRGKYVAKEEWLDSSAEEIVADICNVDNWKLHSDLRQIATNGFEYPRSTEKVDFLYIKGGK
jgi:hypothetical protein